MTTARIKYIVDNAYPFIVSNCFGLWSNCLWYRYDDIEDFYELKEAFFYLLGRLLDEGEVRFIKPGEDVYFVAGQPPPERQAKDVSTHWIAPTTEILAYLRESWPQGAKDFNDAELNLYFYRIPPIVWRNSEGDWVGS